MGLEKEFRANAAKEQGMRVVSDSGKRFANFPAIKRGKGQSFTSEYEIMRGDLTRMMYNASNAQFVFGTSVESFQEKGDSVEVVFSDGRTEQFDLYVYRCSNYPRLPEYPH
jgi:2-polyprenyl-6-methoxyphenol hydroxylase-like FAD-dependent oxidoreductase